jgi:hypothetical protein
MTRPVGPAWSQLRTIETTGVMPQPAAKATQVPRPAAVECGVKLPLGGSSEVIRQAAFGVNSGDDAQQALARRTDQRVRSPHLLARKRGAQNDVLAGDAAVFCGQLRGNLQCQRNSVLGLRLDLRYAQRVKSQHGIKCT